MGKSFINKIFSVALLLILTIMIVSTAKLLGGGLGNGVAILLGGEAMLVDSNTGNSNGGN
ncbi:hypothetical protein MKW92_050716 [Papaver armeniacum]|nr:hypothetical protein MKW92_050716 [Papaver armeniacum]